MFPESPASDCYPALYNKSYTETSDNGVIAIHAAGHIDTQWRIIFNSKTYPAFVGGGLVFCLHYRNARHIWVQHYYNHENHQADGKSPDFPCPAGYRLFHPFPVSTVDEDDF